MKNNYSIKTLQTRGSMHDLHCEDELFVFENEDFIIAAIFDGCSSGIDSHYASYKHKEFLSNEVYRFLDIQNNWIVPEYRNKWFLKEIKKSLHYNTYFKIGEEMLSTIVLLTIDKYNDQYLITFAGDGVCCINGEINNIHNEDNSVMYLSAISSSFEDYYKNYCYTFEGFGVNDISISTDGIDTFKTKFGSLKNIDEVRNLFFIDKEFENNDNMLKRKYNILTNGIREKDLDGKSITSINQDDFTMIRIIKN